MLHFHHHHRRHFLPLLHPLLSYDTYNDRVWNIKDVTIKFYVTHVASSVEYCFSVEKRKTVYIRIITGILPFSSAG